MEHNTNIRKDAGEILGYLYKNKINGEETPSINELIEQTGWQKDRIFFALEYLIRKGLFKGKILKGQESTKTEDIAIFDITPSGIDTIVNEEKFKYTFGFTINLGIFQFSWEKGQR